MLVALDMEIASPYQTTGLKEERKPGDADQYESPEGANDEPIYYEYETSGMTNEMPEADDIPDLDQYLNAEVLLLE